MAKPSVSDLQVVHAGRTRYRACWQLQQEYFDRRIAGRVPDTLILTEHEHVYTMGRNAHVDHLLAGAVDLEARGVDVVEVDRGGDITYHGPGQLVAYPILDLEQHGKDVAQYLRSLEEVVIRVLARLEIVAVRLPGYTGVWVAGEKVCAIGIKASRWVTMHGLALNVATDLSYFGGIIPCGIFERGVTSLREITGEVLPMALIEDLFVAEFCTVFGAATQQVRESMEGR
ncbi:MAG: lipoyl(octanoyl) transferase LipB [Ignavibacteriae bacterium]|nr:lipoyl(octanoyl) transferase LipB [Ignavibacteriota bacterium]